MVLDPNLRFTLQEKLLDLLQNLGAIFIIEIELDYRAIRSFETAEVVSLISFPIGIWYIL